jgi:hypothetical protein
MSWSSQWSLSFWLSHQYPICIPLLSHSCYMPCPSHSPWLYHSNYTWRRVQVMKNDLPLTLHKLLLHHPLITKKICTGVYTFLGGTIHCLRVILNGSRGNRLQGMKGRNNFAK